MPVALSAAGDEMGQAMPGMGNGGSATSPIVSAFHDALLQQLLVVVAIAVAVWAVWNKLRNTRYWRSIAAGTLPAYAVRARIRPEPLARRILRLGFGGLWVLDGLLQLQSAMPLGMPGQVLRPAAASSPTWVRAVAGFGADLWAGHPVLAAASVVWIQLGIGLLLLVSPRGWCSRIAGIATAGWAAVVWVFGEAFGGIFGQGSSWLFGTPGAALIYCIAGGLLAFPERTWSTPIVGRRILRLAGLFFVGMAVLQAWPGRGFWQGAGRGTAGGSLVSMVRQMAQTRQPYVLVRVLHAFARIDASHSWAVNLLVVAVLGSAGLALCISASPVVRPALYAAVGLCLADWVLVQDFGFLGGVGTDPNSMVPMAVLLVSGYVAFARSPTTVVAADAVAVPSGGPVPVAVDRRVAATSDTQEGPWWYRASLGHLTRLAGTVAALGVVVVGVLPMSWAAIR